MKPLYPKEGTQYDRVLRTLLEADGNWVSGNRFLHGMYISQFHAKIFVLENEYHWIIEHSDFRDSYGFMCYRIIQEQPALI